MKMMTGCRYGSRNVALRRQFKIRLPDLWVIAKRTAVTELKKMGCTDEEVTAISGHTLSSFKTRMADVYTGRDSEFAGSAIRKWEGEGV